MTAGALFLFGFSGFILSEDGVPLTAQTVHRGGYRIEIQTPVRVAAPTWRPIPQLTPADLKRILPGADVGTLSLRVAVLPSITDEGKPSLMTILGDTPAEWGKLPRDTIAALAYGVDASRKADVLVEGLVRDLLVWLRLLTNQWWIGRPTEGLTGNLHTIFPLVGERHVEGLPELRARQTSPDEGTKRLNEVIWVDAFDKLRSHQKPRLADTLTSDAKFLYFSREHALCIITICSGIEIAIDYVLKDKGISRKRLHSGTDILTHVSSDFKRLLGRSMEEEEIESFRFLRTLWVARGNVAHGKELLWLVNGKKTPFQDVPSAEFFDGASKVTRWLASL